MLNETKEVVDVLNSTKISNSRTRIAQQVILILAFDTPISISAN